MVKYMGYGFNEIMGDAFGLMIGFGLMIDDC
jgi:hypothetical protein